MSPEVRVSSSVSKLLVAHHISPGAAFRVIPCPAIGGTSSIFQCATRRPGWSAKMLHTCLPLVVYIEKLHFIVLLEEQTFCVHLVGGKACCSGESCVFGVVVRWFRHTRRRYLRTILSSQCLASCSFATRGDLQSMLVEAEEYRRLLGGCGR